MNSDSKVQKFRVEKLKSKVFYLSGWQHLYANIIFAFCVTTLSWLLIERFTPQMFLIIPIAFLVGTFVEYWGHRSLLHINRKFFKTPYQEHTLSHHFYFTHEAIEFEKEADLHFILFNLPALIFFVCLVGPLISGLITFMAGPDIGLFFMGLCGLYFLIYEAFHTIFHLPMKHPILRVYALRKLRDHHLKHHDQSIMNEANFGIVTDLWDRIFKTKI